MQDIVVIITLVTLAFVGVALIGRKNSKNRTRLLEEIDSIEEPAIGESNEFSTLLSKELSQQQQDNEHFEIDADPQITLTDKITSSIQAEQPLINITIEDDIDDFSPDKLKSIEPDSIKNEALAPAKENTLDAEWEMVIAFTVMAREGEILSGRSIKATLDSLDLHFGEMQIYHRSLPGLNKQTLFSVANILAPGTLKPESFATMKTPGLLIFSHLPGPINGLAVFDELLDTAQKMTDKLDGVLSDESRDPISKTSIEAMRSRILDFNLRIQVNESNAHNDY